MLKERNRLLRKVQVFLDIGITALSFFVAYLFRSYADLYLLPIAPISYYLFLLYIILPLWAILLYYNRAYESIRTQSLFETLWPVLKTVFAGGVILMTVLFVFKLQFISRALILLFLFSSAVFLVAERSCIYLFFHHIRKKGYNYRTILLVGTGKRARAFAETILDHKDWGLNIAGFIDIEPSLVGQEILGKKVIGLIKDIPSILTRYQVDEVVFVGPMNWLDQTEKVVLSCEEIGITARIVCDFYPRSLSKIHLDKLIDWPLLTFSPPPHYGDLFAVKRAFDVLFSFTILLLTSPLLFLIVLGIKLTSPGPIFFKQERCGLNGRRFKLLKFRTMVENAEDIKSRVEHLNEMTGPVLKIRNDPRITPVGRFLRKFSLDEFPQFINVLRGDMSIVGPRPPIPDEVEKYEYIQRRRLSVRPGLTCLWQVSGRNKIDFSDWVKLDLEYIDRWSLALDMKIILKTIPAVLKGTGM
jgi:exopolysaccharide biosynthesis polyprenyl glycosylphosphotransferase